jgi:hypothetical protein
VSEAPEIGSVKEKWWERKKILDWTFDTSVPVASPLFEKLGPMVAAVSIEQRGRSTEDESIRFVARSSWFGGKRSDGISASTLEELKVSVAKAFTDMILAHTKVEWEDWIEVEIDRNERERDAFGDDKPTTREDSAHIGVKWEILKRARFPDGRDMVLHGGSLMKFPSPKAAGVECDRVAVRRYSEYWQDTDHQYAYIPATPENLAAMRELVKKIGEVNTRLMGVLAQSSIKSTVKLLTGGRLALESK